MKSTALLLAMALGGVASAAAAHGYGGYQGYQPPKMHAAPTFPEPPKSPRPPEFKSEPRFKPFKGQHLDPPRSGLDPYPAPKKPKGGFSTYGD